MKLSNSHGAREMGFAGLGSWDGEAWKPLGTGRLFTTAATSTATLGVVMTALKATQLRRVRGVIWLRGFEPDGHLPAIT
eukprot:CAMPEP_0119108182 /NCGR_PEP_ID=MMETSP1180-20130426/13512_1 /TAXON_ID=3052 ORGANISM="Chlamydomonas cf sp, Strain CCMP681" /NCGR_SAMPLE_ID=MMETSP1180 /ASSEMBLY_ACC=CAM_ASM_000741 /LENGTH=78 /DNA_ID=CAMNT_0007093771 /DNA_START=1054 /DNA_END=1290 /DNA_ORIENTATION=+